MNKLIVAIATAFCWAGFCASASAFCGTSDANQGCGRPFGNSNNSTQADGETTQQGFDAQTGKQWSSTSHKMGDFTFYSGVSSGNSWDGRRRIFGNGLNGPSFGSQNQVNSPHCVFYGAC
jgi:hypothetical protein